jgi:hypothetical protein
MPKLDYDKLRKILRELVDFARRVASSIDTGPLEAVCQRLETEKLTLKELRGPVHDVMGEVGNQLNKIFFDDYRNVRPGMDSHLEEYGKIWVSFNSVVYPPAFEDIDISGYVGCGMVNVKTAGYRGDPQKVRPVVERSIELVQRYSACMGRGDFDAAYQLTAAGLRAWMSPKRFVTEHEQAARTYGGLPLDYLIDRFQFIYSDDAARRKSTADEGWPKTTPKEERRSCVTGFWICNRAAQTGCAGGFLISEEQGEYRIAKFTFYRP